jgi:FixJ family two-component response regulator
MIMPREHLIAVVDDEATVCRALSTALSINGYAVRAFAGASDYLAERPRIDPVCLLADIRMPGIDGVAMHHAAQRAGLDVPTVFMTAAGDAATVVQAMKAGAEDLLLKPFSLTTLMTAVGAAVDRGLRARAERLSLAELWRSAASLTPREAEVAALVASGRLNKHVAVEIGTGERTVKVHRARAMRKLGAHSVADLVRILDRLLGVPVRQFIVIDGTTIVRPAKLDIMAAALTHDSTSPAGGR